jgi:hypothetical protein
LATAARHVYRGHTATLIDDAEALERETICSAVTRAKT